MKKNRVVIFTFFLLILHISDSVKAGEIIGKGLKAGSNFSKSSGILSPKLRAGFVGGGFITYGISQAMAIQPEFFFSVKGYKVDEHDISVDARFTYLEVPVLIKIKILNSIPSRPELFVGPALAYNLTAKFTSVVQVEGFPVTFSGDIENFNDFDLGLVFGSNFSVNVHSGQIVFDIRFNLGLIDWDSQLGGNKNRTISLMAGYSF